MENDPALLDASLGGNKQAFGQIVRRYQSLLCAIAYSATGDLGLSEDLAQETFLIAWKRLGDLRDRTKLRAWLVGIGRNVINSAIRRRGRDLAGRAKALEEGAAASSMVRSPVEHAISREEEAILWRTLEAIPDTYREPLVLYYREQHSVRKVAEALELSEDAVKQRLSRGRRMLKEQVAAFVGEALERSGPKKQFAIGVLGALPKTVPGASAGAAAAKAGFGAGLSGAALGSVIGVIGGILGSLIPILDARSRRERKFLLWLVLLSVAIVLLFLVVLHATRGGVRIGLSSVFGALLFLVIVWGNLRQRRIRIEDGTWNGGLRAPIAMPRRAAYPFFGGMVFVCGWFGYVWALVAGDWIAGLATLAVLAGIFAFSVGAFFRNRERFYDVITSAVVGTYAVNLGVINLRWNAWGQSLFGSQSGLLLRVTNLTIAAIVSCMVIAYLVIGRKLRNEVQNRGERGMRLNVVGGVLTLLTALVLAFRPSYAVKPEADSFTLENGIRVVSVNFPGSENVSIFTYLPMGLAMDGPGQAQWSHLVEHLVIRSTISGGLQEANAETLHDHMRLDFYGTLENWEEGLSHHARWLEGVPFTEENLGAEKPKIKAEGDFVSSRFMTHKFAFAAWAQGYRHGQSHAAVNGDVKRATLGEIQQYRDEHMGVLDRVVVCVAGGIDAATLKPIVSERLGTVKSNAKPFAPVRLGNADHEMTWDVDARHILITRPIPDFRDDDYAALMVASQWLQMGVFSDSDLRALTGAVFAGADLRVPEGNYFYISASLRPESSFDDVREKLNAHVATLRSGGRGLANASMIGRQLSYQLSQLVDPAMVKAQAPAGMSDRMIEGNIGLQWGMYEFRYGEHRAELAKRLANVTPDGIKKAALKYLSEEKSAACTLRPK
jgi:RNA polymerase sigma factor (sigma-70 family)